MELKTLEKLAIGCIIIYILGAIIVVSSIIYVCILIIGGLL